MPTLTPSAPSLLPRPVPAPVPDDPTIWRVDDALWAHLAPLPRIDKPRKKPGRPRRDDRQILDGILWLLTSATPTGAGVSVIKGVLA